MGDFRNALGELADGAVPIFLMGLTPLEEAANDLDELFRCDDFVVEGDAAILEEGGKRFSGTCEDAAFKRVNDGSFKDDVKTGLGKR